MRLRTAVLAIMLGLIPMVGMAQDTPAPAAPAAPASAPAEGAATAPAAAAPDAGVPVTMTTEKAAEGAAEAAKEVDPEDAGALISALITAFKQGKWAWAVGLILMLLTWLFNRIFKNRIPKKVVPWVAISLGVASNIAMSIATGMKWFEALGSGFTMGLAAIGGWEALGKMFKKREG